MRTLVSLILALLLVSCTTIRLEKPPLLSPFGDGTQWIVWEDMEFVVELNDKSRASIVVPRGFVTDLASTPRSLWELYPPFGKYLSASILHDYLYWRQTCKREEADKIIYQAMRDAGVKQETQTAFFDALDKWGKKAYAENGEEKKKGLVRIVPAQYLEDGGMVRSTEVSWPVFRNYLKMRNVKESPPDTDRDIPKACTSLGREIKVKTGLIAGLSGG